MANDDEAQSIKKGDRLIYYAQEAATFFAVATVTGDVFSSRSQKIHYLSIDQPKANFFQIDIDTETGHLTNGVPLDSIELGKLPRFS